VRYAVLYCCDYQSFLVTVSAVNAVENCVEFKVFVVHREGWAFSSAANTAKMEFYAVVKRLREELGLTYVRSAQPVAVHNFGGQKQDQGLDGDGDGQATTELYLAEMYGGGAMRARGGHVEEDDDDDEADGGLLPGAADMRP
jgi:hypothetical protein